MDDRAAALWLTIASLVALGIVLVIGLLAPFVWWLSRRLEAAQDAREAALMLAVEASEQERRRVARTLHDGPVQEFVAASLALVGAADRLRGITASSQDGSSRPPAAIAADEVDAAAGTIRRGVAGLRGLLVELAPPRLSEAGIVAAVEVRDDGVGFDPDLLAARRREGHLGVAGLTDLAVEDGATFAVRTAPGAGTTWRMMWPSSDEEEMA
ncbi:MAG: histidine kinase [Mobilicoccus sp.]|nr:histidine kinase [Mobilicoccus sp.]